MPRRLFWPIALFLTVLACGTPRPATTPTKEPPTMQLTDVPTAPPEPTKAPGHYISHAELGDAWPLEVEKGYILCMGGGKIVLQTDRGLYAVNGTARGANRWRDIRDITKPDPKNEGLIMSVQPIIDRGLIVCK